MRKRSKNHPCRLFRTARFARIATRLELKIEIVGFLGSPGEKKAERLGLKISIVSFPFSLGHTLTADREAVEIDIAGCPERPFYLKLETGLEDTEDKDFMKKSGLKYLETDLEKHNGLIVELLMTDDEFY